ncbi:MAG: ISKra4 family transposase [Chthonomonadaceae bacterium]|nr:ISKra4 family transposase [Chthonomonadaceae bacterium]
MSSILQKRCVDWATRFCYGEGAALLQEYCGSALLSEDSLWRLVVQQATRLDAEQGEALAAIAEQSELALPAPVFRAVSESGLYDTQMPEFVALTDAICVASQKPTRQKAGETRLEKEAKRHDTDVFVLPRRDGGEQFFCEGLSETWSCVAAVAAFLRQEWSGVSLSVVAITDGAKKIRSDLSALFGVGVRVILDWYHLGKRVKENLSMVAHSTPEREEWEKVILGFLWVGNVSEALSFLSGLTARREKAKTDLLGYLEKHASEIIDYGRRQEAGKAIGSGRMEKAVDQVIGVRQKNRGMSWTKQGSRALALLTVAKLNTRCPAKA